LSGTSIDIEAVPTQSDALPPAGTAAGDTTERHDDKALDDDNQTLRVRSPAEAEAAEQYGIAPVLWLVDLVVVAVGWIAWGWNGWLSLLVSAVLFFVIAARSTAVMVLVSGALLFGVGWVSGAGRDAAQLAVVPAKTPAATILAAVATSVSTPRATLVPSPPVDATAPAIALIPSSTPTADATPTRMPARTSRPTSTPTRTPRPSPTPLATPSVPYLSGVTVSEVIAAFADYDLACDIGEAYTSCENTESQGWDYTLTIESRDASHVELISAQMVQFGELQPMAAEVYFYSLADVTYAGAKPVVAKQWINSAWSSATEHSPAETDIGTGHFALYVTQSSPTTAVYGLDLRASGY
jgi:hypothetical protein